MTLLAQAPSGSLRYTFLWADSIPSNASLVGVTYTVQGDGVIAQQFIDTVAKTSTIQVNGIPHAGICRVTALSALSNAELVPDQQLVIRCFNG